jgi:hypothetical protein
MNWLRDGRFVMLLALVIYGVVVQYPSFTSYAPHFSRMGIPPASREPITFADMRGLTSAWDCTRRGIDVLERNPCDPIAYRPANYPTLWLRLSFLGLGEKDSTMLGVLVGLVFLAAVFFLAGRLTVGEGVVWSVLLLSPSVMLGVERGNVDILIFAMLVLAITGIARRGVLARAAGCGLIELAAFLKLFPIFAAGAVLHWHRRPALGAFVAMAAIFTAYAAAIHHQLETIRRVVPREISTSFGAGVLVDGLKKGFNPGEFLDHDRTAAIAVVVLATLLVAVGFAAALARRRPHEPEASTRLPWYWAGAGIFVGVWAVTENSYDYRLVFCLLAVPQMLEWARQDRPVLPLARPALTLLALTLWLSDTFPLFSSGITEPWIRAERNFPVDELLVWMLIVYFVGGLLLTLPVWFADAPLLARPMAWWRGASDQDRYPSTP